MDMVGFSGDGFRLDEMAELYGVDVCCVSWQTKEGGWARVTNNQTSVSVEQMDASSLHKFLFTRLAPTFYEDMAQVNSISSDPLVSQHPKYRFYAEALLADDHGRLFGSVSIAHRSPKSCQDINFPDAGWLKSVRDMAITFNLDASSEDSSPLRGLRAFKVPHKTDRGSQYPLPPIGLLSRLTDSYPSLTPRCGSEASCSSGTTLRDIDCEHPPLAERVFTASSSNSWDM